MNKEIRGTIYDTSTAEPLAHYIGNDKSEVLYRTPSNELFLYKWPYLSDDLRAMDVSTAHAWLLHRFDDANYVKL